MRKMKELGFLFWIFAILADAECSDIVEFGNFVNSIIDAWRLQSPTLVVQGDLPPLCMRREWMLCLTTNSDSEDLVEHLTTLHKQRKQDGIIFLGKEGLETMLKQLNADVPTMLTSNNPVFMSASFQDNIALRLDSNVIFYEEKLGGRYELYDIFAVKDELPIREELGYWDMKSGISLLTSMNRWDRRTNLMGASFITAVTEYSFTTGFIRDEKGNIVGIKGMFSDQLHYITDQLNVTVEIVDVPWDFNLYENGSYGGGLGMLQRREVDVFTMGTGINLQRSLVLDLPLPTWREPMTLIAAIPKGTSINFWVYVRLFCFTSWIISLALLLLVVTAIAMTNAVTEDVFGRDFGTRKSSNEDYKLNSAASGLALVYLYTLQMGSHTNSRQLSSRLQTLTTSILTFVLFAYYATNITAEMTSGPPDIPVRNFQDVIIHGYKVVTNTAYWENILASAQPGSAKNKVYTSHFQRIMEKNAGEAMKEVVNNPKTLFFANPSSQVGQTVGKQTFALRMDDATYGHSTHPLQKNSQFYQIFNHYILKGMETGVIMRLFHNYVIDLHTKENFEMIEAPPLGYENVMFCYICLVIGIIVSLLLSSLEFIGRQFTQGMGKGYPAKDDSSAPATTISDSCCKLCGYKAPNFRILSEHLMTSHVS